MNKESAKFFFEFCAFLLTNRELDDIIKYVIDHKDEFEFDEDVQNILNDYSDNDEEER